MNYVSENGIYSHTVCSGAILAACRATMRAIGCGRGIPLWLKDIQAFRRGLSPQGFPYTVHWRIHVPFEQSGGGKSVGLMKHVAIDMVASFAYEGFRKVSGVECSNA